MPSVYVRRKDPKTGRWKAGRIREGRGVKTGDLTGPFYIRPFVNGKQGWRPLQAQNYLEAKAEAEQAESALEAHGKGLTVAEAASLTGTRMTVRAAVDTYLEQKSGKAPKTVAQYKTTLEEFLEAVQTVNVRFLDQITDNEAGRNILRAYKKFLEDQDYAGKTMDTRINIVNFLLKKNDIKARLPKDEMPTVKEEPAVPYTEEELEKLFAAMTPEESIRYKFFLGTACRDKEVTFASWQDLNLDKKSPTYTVRHKEDVGFNPKSNESRTIPIPTSLATLLRERHKKPANPRWIFVNDGGRPDNHFLRKLKRVAMRAGINCGHCKTTITTGRWNKRREEVTCKTHPVCEHFYLHRLRKTCATRWEQHGVPIRTIQHYLGHKNLETTMIYLGVTDSEKLRGNIDAAFGD
jgi:integrase/recombinase XerD